MSTRDEIPSTEQGIILYIEYCIKQIKENKNHIRRLETRIEWCYEKAQKMGFDIKRIDE